MKVANDADVQGCAVAQGEGFEFVLTLGTGVGTALFSQRRAAPPPRAGHAQFRKGETFEDQLGNAGPQGGRATSAGARGCSRRSTAYDRFLFYDHVYLGGGNSKHLKADELPAKATIVPNTAGILGGVQLWEMDLHV